jgi:CubicO group peptidase (beta-lactamase class C family)
VSQGPVIHGECDPRLRAVREAFEEGFRSRDEVGAAVCVTLDGEPVVDLWAGHADQAKTRAWQRDTLVNVYSTTKGMTALCAHRLVERGQLDLDAFVTDYWPEFKQAGKHEIPVRWLLSHRAALPAVAQPLPPEALYDWDAMTTALAAQAPWWKPGEQHGYHVLTFGWLVGEVVRRISGRSLGTFFREEFAEPLGLDFHIGLDAGEHPRAAELSELPMQSAGRGDANADAAHDGGPKLLDLVFSDPEGMTARAFLNPPSIAAGPNVPAWRSAEIPGANGHGTARSVARIYGALARGGAQDGVGVLAPESIERCRLEQSSGHDAVLGIETRFGAGFMLSQDRPDAAFGPNPGAFGHPGAGGSVGFADPEARLGFAYVMNRMGPHILLDPRATALIDAVYASLR